MKNFQHKKHIIERTLHITNATNKNALLYKSRRRYTTKYSKAEQYIIEI